MTAKVDFGLVADDYQRHRLGFPSSFITRLQNDAVLLSGKRVLDIATGTGSLAHDMAQIGCDVIGLDISSSMIQKARHRNTDLRRPVKYLVSRAESLPFEAEMFDVVTIGQAWHWFDRSRAAAETYRILKPKGKIVIAHFDWIPLRGNVVEATEHLIKTFNPDWNMDGGTGLYPAWFSDIAIANFGSITSFSFDLDVDYTHEAWCGRIRASAGVGASLSATDAMTFDVMLRALLTKEFSADPLKVAHRVFAVVGEK